MNKYDKYKRKQWTKQDDFFAWLKIPTDSTEQNNLPIGQNRNGNVISDFEFVFTDMAGKVQGYLYKMDKSRENTLLLFPSG